MAALLSRYRTLDMTLRVFEEALVEVATAWDEHVEREVDRARGKIPTITWKDDDGQEHAVELW